MRVEFGPDREQRRLFLRVQGRLEHATTPYVWEALEDALSLDWPEVVLDLREVTGIDEDGVAMVTHALEVAKERGVHFKLVDGTLEATAMLKAAPVHRHLDLVQPLVNPYEPG